MDTVERHNHDFSTSSWPFKEPENTAVFTSSEVLHHNHPLLLVFHDHDGDWQFLHGEVGPDDEGHVVCLGCVFSRDSTVGQLADMPNGWFAYRDEPGKPWEIEPYESNEDED